MAAASRRAFVLGGLAVLAGGAGAAAAVEADLLPGRVGLETALGLGRVDGVDPAGPVGDVHVSQFDSRARRQKVTWAVFLPPGHTAEGLPVAVFLHGRGGNALSTRDGLHAQSYLAAHVRAGRPPLALVSVDGGDRYWHPRADGDDPLAMITDELLPRVGELGARVDRIATMGYSMGGYGSLLMARQAEASALGGVTVAAATASSPALFPSWGSSSGVAFDGPADWARWGDLATRPGVRHTPLSVSCGTTDPFAEITRTYRAHCARRPAGGLSSGRHDEPYWRSLLPAQLEFVSPHLAV